MPPVLGRPHTDHKSEMIANLIQHIRESLAGIPYDLLEIKELWVKLPEAYTGDDNFNKLDNWLQGLLRYFKLNHLMVDDWDADCILVTGIVRNRQFLVFEIGSSV